ncbi:Gfo/Idh/MocA family oxidoreductase [Microbacteriaceae bacterium VKM Ac-2855]|nr:Gfo/Idh/MocA family oxidoreductase [Microbacteriaceae bacterium VKM Ac-2855]
MTDAAPPASRLRVAVVGTGGVAHLHAQALQTRTDVELVAAIDVDAGRAADFAERYGFEGSGTAMADLPAIDVVHLCTPPGIHAEQAETAFALGAHVVVEKPPALTLTEVDRMIVAAERAGRLLAVVFQQRTGTAAAHVKRLLDEGAFGRVLVARCDTLWFRGPEYFAVPWRGTWESEGGGTTISHGIHQLDLLAHLLGEVAEVTGQAWRLGREIETEDVSTAVLRFESGAIASVLTSAISPRETSSIRIDTEKATIELEHLYGHGHANWRITPAPGVVPAPDWSFPEDEVPSGHVAYLDAVYGAIATGSALPDVATAPARSLEIVAALYASSRTGAAVSIAAMRDPAARGLAPAAVVDLR